MPTFTIETPGGKRLTIEAPDEAQAIAGAQQWHAEQTPRRPLNNMEKLVAGEPVQGETEGGGVAGMAKSLASGIGSGVAGMIGLPGLAKEGVGAGLDYLISKGLLPQKAGTPEQQAKAEAAIPNLTPNAQTVQKAIESQTGEFYKPQTTPEKYAHTIGEFAPGMLMGGPPSLLGRAATNVLGPALFSETAGQLTEGSKAEPYARVAGALLGGVAPSAAGRVVTPAPASAARQRLVNILQDEGVTSLTAGQRTGNEALKTAESTLGNAPFTGQAANRVTREGEEQLTEAALRRAGAAGRSAEPQILAANSQRLGNEFETLSARNTMQMDPQFANDIRTVVQDYARVLPSEQRERIFNIITDLSQYGNTVPGNVYQATRSRLSRSAKNNTAGDPDYADALRGLRNALDDAMGRSVAPADQAAWQAARREYGAQRTIEKTMSGASEAAGEGRIPPQALRATVSAENRGAFARGEGQMSELARAASTIMKPVPDSGTARRSALYSLSNWGTLGAIPAVAGRLLMSRPVQGYLSNQAMAPALANMDPRRAAIVSALLSGQQEAPQFNLGRR